MFLLIPARCQDVMLWIEMFCCDGVVMGGDVEELSLVVGGAGCGRCWVWKMLGAGGAGCGRLKHRGRRRLKHRGEERTKKKN